MKKSNLRQLHADDIARAVEMLKVAAKYIEEHYPDGTIDYDATACDGYCVADDCRDIAEMLEGVK
jgi:hypothetical protein